MRYRALDANLLVVLHLLLETSSVTRAAERLGLSQPAVSAALSRLRQHFDDEILIQVGRLSVATPLGESLRAPLKDLLARTDALISRRAGFDPAEDHRTFSLIGSDYVATTFGDEILREVASSGPGLSARLELLGAETMDAFERGQFDVIIAPRQIACADHPSVSLFDERFVCAVWDQHPEIGDTISADVYAKARHVVVHSIGSSRLPILDQWFLQQAAIVRKVAVEVPSFAHILPILPGTPYIATVQHRLASKMSRRLPIRLLPTPFEFPLIQIVMQWHRLRDADAGVKWFRERIEGVIGNLGW